MIRGLVNIQKESARTIKKGGLALNGHRRDHL